MNEITNSYFNWLCYDIGATVHNLYNGHKRLLYFLFTKEFVWDQAFPLDGNRSKDGLSLRDRFDPNLFDILPVNATVLEVMVALAERCESIMADSRCGNQTPFWFWEMIGSMGLYFFNDNRYDEMEVNKCIERCLNREYDYDGNGGFFTIPGITSDMRDVDIWTQMCWYQRLFIDI